MDDRGRYHEEDIFDMIRSSKNQENEQEPRDEGQTNNDGEENVRQLTKSGEVYIY